VGELRQLQEENARLKRAENEQCLRLHELPGSAVIQAPCSWQGLRYRRI